MEELITRQVCEQRAEDLRRKADHNHCEKCANALREIAAYWDGQALTAPDEKNVRVCI